MSNSNSPLPSCSPFQSESVAAMPLIHLTEVKLAPRTSLCLLVDLSDFSLTGLRHLESLLSSSERQQYANIVADTERRQRQATRAVLRLVLGQVTGVSPAQVPLGMGKHGKPYMISPGVVNFSVSHSQSYSLIALSRCDVIGCDIEGRFQDDDVHRLGPVVLHAAELESMRGLKNLDLREAFMRCWVRKEAVLKAMGTGLGADPRRVMVGSGYASAGCTGPQERQLHLHDGPAVAGCMTAVASEDPTCNWYSLAV
ncbi:4'-phosphopantetheinyl transferase family protein [Polaromonas sp.]|uniref:4'-phosphopantetheinyl transferase family protein n=1 Tax=Polaromonas sp. TaxID=1869339 RepID=UPI002FCB484D